MISIRLNNRAMRSSREKIPASVSWSTVCEQTYPELLTSFLLLRLIWLGQLRDAPSASSSYCTEYVSGLRHGGARLRPDRAGSLDRKPCCHSHLLRLASEMVLNARVDDPPADELISQHNGM